MFITNCVDSKAAFVKDNDSVPFVFAHPTDVIQSIPIHINGPTAS